MFLRQYGFSWNPARNQILPGVSFLLPSTERFTQLGVVLEGSAARLQAVTGARDQQSKQSRQRHGAIRSLPSKADWKFPKVPSMEGKRDKFLALNQHAISFSLFHVTGAK
eukprot:s1213_g2.t1